MAYKNPTPDVDSEYVSNVYSIVPFRFENAVTRKDAVEGINNTLKETGGQIPENWVRMGEAVLASQEEIQALKDPKAIQVKTGPGLIKAEIRENCNAVCATVYDKNGEKVSSAYIYYDKGSKQFQVDVSDGDMVHTVPMGETLAEQSEA